MSEMLQMKRMVAATVLMIGGGALVGCSGGGEQTEKPIKLELGPCGGVQNTIGVGTNMEICYPEKNLRVVAITNPNGTKIVLNEVCHNTTLEIRQEKLNGTRKILVPPVQENMPVCDDGVLTPSDYRGLKENSLY
jgi:hypothetical protein